MSNPLYPATECSHPLVLWLDGGLIPGPLMDSHHHPRVPEYRVSVEGKVGALCLHCGEVLAAPRHLRLEGTLKGVMNA